MASQVWQQHQDGMAVDQESLTGGNVWRRRCHGEVSGASAVLGTSPGEGIGFLVGDGAHVTN